MVEDFLVWGFGDTEEEAIKDCNRNLDTFLKRAREKNYLKLNAMNVKLQLTHVPFICHVLTAEGVKIDPRKVEAVTKMPKPQTSKS